MDFERSSFKELSKMKHSDCNATSINRWAYGKKRKLIFPFNKMHWLMFTPLMFSALDWNSFVSNWWRSNEMPLFLPLPPLRQINVQIKFQCWQNYLFHPFRLFHLFYTVFSLLLYSCVEHRYSRINLIKCHLCGNFQIITKMYTKFHCRMST